MELRWLREEGAFTRSDVLQYRVNELHLGNVMRDGNGYFWSEWKDVPIVVNQTNKSGGVDESTG